MRLPGQGLRNRSLHKKPSHAYAAVVLSVTCLPDSSHPRNGHLACTNRLQQSSGSASESPWLRKLQQIFLAIHSKRDCPPGPRFDHMTKECNYTQHGNHKRASFEQAGSMSVVGRVSQPSGDSLFWKHPCALGPVVGEFGCSTVATFNHARGQTKGTACWWHAFPKGGVLVVLVYAHAAISGPSECACFLFFGGVGWGGWRVDN